MANVILHEDIQACLNTLTMGFKGYYSIVVFRDKEHPGILALGSRYNGHHKECTVELHYQNINEYTLKHIDYNSLDIYTMPIHNIDVAIAYMKEIVDGEWEELPF